METITIQENIYRFNELKKEVRDQMIENRRESKNNDMAFCTDFLEERFQEIAEEKGFINPAFCWSLSHCQGDGVSFTSDVDVREFLRKEKALSRFKAIKGILNSDNVSFIVKRDTHHYYHHNTVSVYYDVYDYDTLTEKQEGLLEELRDWINDVKDEICKECENIGYAEYEFQLSDRCIQEEIEEMNEKYYEDGSVYLGSKEVQVRIEE